MNKRLFAVSTTNSNRGAGKPFPGAIPTEGGPEEYEVQMEVTNEPHCLEDDAEEQPVKSQRPTVTRRALGVSSAGFRAPRSPPAKKKRPVPTEGGYAEDQIEATLEPHCLEDDAEEHHVKSQRPTEVRRALGVSSAGFRAPRSPPAKKKRPVLTDAVRGPRHSPPLKDIGLGRADYSGRSVCSVEELTALEQRVKALEDNAQRHGEKLVRLYGMMDGLVEDVCGSVRRTTDELSVTVLRAVDEISDDVTYALRCIYHELREDEEE
ncbi:hypothetical protein GPALN_007755 [Globodera pallida]|nr:hypothetical protein GPALN_007755 [Globodera pallida]